ncbi:hypothetical protein HYX58_01765 [Candidatus Dependentiae bacterium]|nr:hypothetical protein [Candidatus Dependentiae bacterium]
MLLMLLFYFFLLFFPIYSMDNNPLSSDSKLSSFLLKNGKLERSLIEEKMTEKELGQFRGRKLINFDGKPVQTNGWNLTQNQSNLWKKLESLDQPELTEVCKKISKNELSDAFNIGLWSRRDDGKSKEIRAKILEASLSAYMYKRNHESEFSSTSGIPITLECANGKVEISKRMYLLITAQSTELEKKQIESDHINLQNITTQQAHLLIKYAPFLHDQYLLNHLFNKYSSVHSLNQMRKAAHDLKINTIIEAAKFLDEKSIKCSDRRVNLSSDTFQNLLQSSLTLQNMQDDLGDKESIELPNTKSDDLLAVLKHKPDSSMDEKMRQLCITEQLECPLLKLSTKEDIKNSIFRQSASTENLETISTKMTMLPPSLAEQLSLEILGATLDLTKENLISLKNEFKDSYFWDTKDNLALSYDDTEIKIQDLGENKIVKMYKASTQFSDQSKRILKFCGSKKILETFRHAWQNNKIIIRDFETNKQTYLVHPTDHCIRTLAVSPDGRYIATMIRTKESNSKIYLWNVNNAVSTDITPDDGLEYDLLEFDLTSRCLKLWGTFNQSKVCYYDVNSKKQQKSIENTERKFNSNEKKFYYYKGHYNETGTLSAKAVTGAHNLLITDQSSSITANFKIPSQITSLGFLDKSMLMCNTRTKSGRNHSCIVDLTQFVEKVNLLKSLTPYQQLLMSQIMIHKENEEEKLKNVCTENGKISKSYDEIIKFGEENSHLKKPFQLYGRAAAEYQKLSPSVKQLITSRIPVQISASDRVKRYFFRN